MKDLAAWAAMIGAAAAMIRAAVGYGKSQQQLGDLAAAHVADTAALTKRADAQDDRTRALESAQSATAASLSAIQRDVDAQGAELGRIDDKLDQALSHHH